jgi:ABC-type phosphate/phosphonate transport system substrate-binding protein
MNSGGRIAALPMYDFAPLRVATDAWWSALAHRLSAAGVADVPEALTRDIAPVASWQDKRLLLGQSCQYPLSRLDPVPVRLVAIPSYRAPGCSGSRYSSAIVVRHGDPARQISDLHGRRCAINERESNSGYNLLRVTLARAHVRAPFFSLILYTGAHLESARAVAESRADVAAIDCVSFALIGRSYPALLSGLRVLDWTVASPGLPYVTARDTDTATLRRMRGALHDAVSDPALQSVRETLLLAGFDEEVDENYTEVRALAAEAAAHGYPDIA